MKKSDAYRIYRAGDCKYALDLLYGGNKELVDKGLVTIYNNLKDLKMGPSTPALFYLVNYIEKNEWTRTLRDTVLPTESH